MIDNIRQRLDQGPAGLVERVDEALRLQSVEHVRNFLSKIGCPFSSAELCEYRKTLFPPNSLVDPLTQDAPVLLPGFADAPNLTDPSSPCPPCLRGESPQPTDTGALITDDCSLITPSPGSALLTDLRDLLNRYVVLPEMAAETLALWVVHTYAFTLR
jgi:hypothetical protein